MEQRRQFTLNPHQPYSRGIVFDTQFYLFNLIDPSDYIYVREGPTFSLFVDSVLKGTSTGPSSSVAIPPVIGRA